MATKFQFRVQPPVCELNITELAHVLDALIETHTRCDDADKRRELGEVITRLNDVWRDYFTKEAS